MPRIIILTVITLCMVACASNHKDYAKTSSSAPSFYGRYEAITDQDRDAILNISEKKVSEVMPGAEIKNVKVFDSTQVCVTYVKESTDDADCFVLRKAGGHWKVD